MVSSHEDYEGSYGDARVEESSWYLRVVSITRLHMDKIWPIQFDSLAEDWALFDHYLSYSSSMAEVKSLTWKLS